MFNQNIYGNELNKIVLFSDNAVFKKNKKEILLEIYLSIDESSLNYTKINDEWKTNIAMDLEILNKRGKKINDLNFLITHTIEDPDSLKSEKFYQNAFQILINDDAASFNAKIYDKKNVSEIIKFHSNLNKITPTRGNNYISDLEIAYLIKNKSKESVESFTKDSIEIIPNPSRSFGKENKNLYYYIEIYNINSNDLARLGIKVLVKDSNNKIIISENYNKSLKQYLNQLFGMISIENLINGEYFLEIVFEDSNSVYMSNKKKDFNVISDFIASSNSTNLSNDELLKAQISIKSIEALDEEFKVAQHFATGKEKRNYKKLNSHQEKVDFLTQFWTSIDSDPLTIENESRIETINRFHFVNKKYSIGLKQGFETDRGRVYIIYGKPDEIMRDQYDGDIRPNEIWRYHNIEGGIIFVFCDVNGSSNFRLIHSTHSKELQNYNFIARMRR